MKIKSNFLFFLILTLIVSCNLKETKKLEIPKNNEVINQVNNNEKLNGIWRLIKVNDTLFLSGHIIDTEEPLMCYYDEYEMHPHDPSNWWVASPSCILGMAKRIGFKNCEMLGKIKDKKSFLPDKIRHGIRDLTKVGTFKLSK